MTFTEAQAVIESDSIVTRVNIASGLQSFLHAIQSEDAFKELCKMLSDKDVQERVLTRLIQITRQRVDTRYENPWDTALVIYLWAMSLAQPHLSVVAAEVVAQAPQCWWAQKLSSRLLKERPVQTVSTEQSHAIASTVPATSFFVAPDTVYSQIRLDNALVSAPTTSAIHIHIPSLTGNISNVSDVEVSNVGHGYVLTAANQDLAIAA